MRWLVTDASCSALFVLHSHTSFLASLQIQLSKISAVLILAAPPFDVLPQVVVYFHPATPPPHPHVISHIWADVPTSAMSLPSISIASIVIGFISFSFTLAIVSQCKVPFRDSRQCRATSFFFHLCKKVPQSCISSSIALSPSLYEHSLIVFFSSGFTHSGTLF